ncbi:MAG: iron-containing alcohol dehydrogenase [bacterium]
MKILPPTPEIRLMPLSEIQEDRDVALIYSRAAWESVQDYLHLPVVWKREVNSAREADWQEILHEIQGEVIYAVGGGLAVDVAKFLAAKKDAHLVCIPTCLSVDAFFTSASGVRQANCVRYLQTKPPNCVVVDFDILSTAPRSVQATGICDVLSIATGCWDWKYAENLGKNPPNMKFASWAYQAAQAILEGALNCAESAGRGDHQGLKQLLDCLLMEVQLCNLIGHARPEEGSEHYFAYAAENHLSSAVPHGDLVGPGIQLMARIQGQEAPQIEKALVDCGVPLDNISKDIIAATLRELPTYCRHHNLPHGIAHDLTEEMTGKIIPL